MVSPADFIRSWWTSLRGSAPAPTQEVTHIRAGMELHGVIHANAGSAVMVEGVQHGDIFGAQTVFVAAGGKVDGSVHAEEVIVAGEIDGEVHAGHRTEVHATGVIVGLVHTKAALFLEGARVNGTVRIGDPVRLAARGGVRTLSNTSASSAPVAPAPRSTTRVVSGGRSGSTGSSAAAALKPLPLEPMPSPVSVTPLRPATSAAEPDAEIVLQSSYRMTL